MPLLLAVSLLGHVFHPVHDLSIEALLNGNVGQGCAWRGAVPMLFARREPHLHPQRTKIVFAGNPGPTSPSRISSIGPPKSPPYENRPSTSSGQAVGWGTLTCGGTYERLAQPQPEVTNSAAASSPGSARYPFESVREFRRRGTAARNEH
jgi:hypothetical protein